MCFASTLTNSFLPMRTVILSILACIAACTPAAGQLPTDPAVRIDTLGNGLVTYVRHNDEPSGRAVLRLVLTRISHQRVEASFLKP